MSSSTNGTQPPRIKARAAVLFGAKQKLQIKDVEIDQPKPLEVHVKIHSAGVCGSDLHVAEGDWGSRFKLPIVLGHEGAGVVQSVGAAVTRVKPGDHVILLFKENCGRCDNCQVGRPSLCKGHPRYPGTMFDGTNRIWVDGEPCYAMSSLGCWATDCVVSEENVLPIDKTIPLNRAVLVGCGVMTGVGAAINTAKVEVGSSCVVVGCGGVGLNCVQGAKLNNAGMIIAVDIFESKLEAARDFGATHTINARTVDAVAEVTKLTGGGAHFAIDALGSARTSEQCVEMIRPGGTAVIVGMAPSSHRAQIDIFTIARDEKCIKGSYYGSARPGVDMIRLLELYKQKRLKLDELVSKTIKIEECNEALALLKEGGVARTIIDFAA
ncbi:alcohol dehydrogenase class III [Gonapodya prolifera JEL478]|uniref:Alcohol dehydrogenase class III n=1 Tax=Gonapodya prolifera (strain JEL478) TaxID=1344416 RepID=A0A139AXP6_GONPJ|nr:alcohol dehydrogenase class III [Gonapodya prolifera JEL478]|eukprot:KXS21490.1 alcohol dehydrogenase class III [Gonapodya prolifera JEL478]